MSTVNYVFASGEERTVDALEGTSVMHAAVSNLIPGIIGECGGEMSCATCHVYVGEEWIDRLAPMEQGEIDMLEVTAAEPDVSSRLSCQIVCTRTTDGITVRIPEVQ